MRQQPKPNRDAELTAGALLVVVVVAVIVTLILLPAVCERICFGADPAVEAAPPLGLSLPCKVTEIYDGDTATVEVTLTMRVRLLDCWAAEIRTNDEHEKAVGLAARDALKTVAEGKSGRLFVPLDGLHRFDDAISLGRVLGHIWIDDHAGPVNLSTWQRDHGHAFRTKDALLKTLAP